MLVGYTVKLLAVVVLYIFMYTMNKKRDREAAERGELTEELKRVAVERGMRDQTELENKDFRYSL